MRVRGEKHEAEPNTRRPWWKNTKRIVAGLMVMILFCSAVDRLEFTVWADDEALNSELSTEVDTLTVEKSTEENKETETEDTETDKDKKKQVRIRQIRSLHQKKKRRIR